MRGFPLKFNKEEILNQPPHLFIQSNQSLKLFHNSYEGSYIKFSQISVTSRTSSKDNGVFFYIRDKKTEKTWSVGLWPSLKVPDLYEITFDTKVLEFKNIQNEIESTLKVALDQLNNIIIYELTLENKSSEPKDLEIINYSNLVLIDDFRKVLDHRAFHNLSVQSRYDKDLGGIYFKKRVYNSNTTYPLVFFKFYSEVLDAKITFESNRDKFIGRTKDLVNPGALHHDLTNFEGNVLDPIAGFKTEVNLQPNSKSRFYLSIVCDQFEQNIQNLVNANISTFNHTSEYFSAICTQEIPLLRELNIDERKAILYQRMGSFMITGNNHTDLIKRNLPPNSGSVNSLWKNKISGDYPILLVSIDNLFFNELVIDVINFHKYLVRSGYDLDIVFLIETDPNEDTLNLLTSQITTLGYQNKIDKNTGVFILESYTLEESDLNYLRHFARLIFNSSNFNQVLDNE